MHPRSGALWGSEGAGVYWRDVLRLNLASLTAEELQIMLGETQTQRLLPEISSARLAGKPYLGEALSQELHFAALEERDWGATPEQSRTLRSLDTQLLEAGAQPLGVFYSADLAQARHQRAYVLAEIALALRWSETPAAGVGTLPFLQAITLTKDRASGVAASLSSTSQLAFAPAPSEEIDARLVTASGIEEFLSAHRALSMRHGKGQKMAGEADWLRAFQVAQQLNCGAWQRRGVLVETQSRAAAL